MKRFVTVAALIASLGGSAAASTAAASIRPGVQTLTAGAGQCTSNFIFRDASNMYIGQAAHCSGTGAAAEANGCTSGSLPLGTAVQVAGASRPGTLAYNSWLTMRSTQERDANACRYNDFALVRLDPADVPNVDPSVRGFGGPTGIGGAVPLQPVFSFGNSSLRGAVTILNPKQGIVIASKGDGWSRTVLTATPGIPGDSGSGFLNAAGQAIGVLSTLNFAPLPATNGVGDLRREIDYMRAHTELDGVELVPGTKPFTGNLLGAIVSG